MSIIKYLVSLSAFAMSALLMSCSSDDHSDETSAEGLFITFSVNGASYGTGVSTRATRTEAGWDNWNENKINCLDLFIFNSNGDIKYHCSATESSDLTGTWQPRYNGTALSASSVSSTDQIYLVANYNFSSADVTTLDDLKDLSFTMSNSCREKQTSFVMDGSVSGDDTNITTESDEYGNINKKTIKINLSRALAKMCIRVRYTPLNISTAEQVTDFSDMNISMRLMQYSNQSALIAGGTYMPTDDGTNNNGIANGITSEDDGIYDSGTILTYPTESDTSTDGLGLRAVFYFCANEWYDETVSMNESEPIVEDLQTYVYLRLLQNFNYYYYKVPVNYLLPQDNDAVSPDDASSYYKIDRNTAYYVVLNIQEQEGGFKITISDEAGTAISDLEDGGNINYEY